MKGRIFNNASYAASCKRTGDLLRLNHSGQAIVVHRSFLPNSEPRLMTNNQTQKSYRRHGGKTSCILSLNKQLSYISLAGQASYAVKLGNL